VTVLPNSKNGSTLVYLHSDKLLHLQNVYNTLPKYEQTTGISFTQGTFVYIIFKENAGAPLKK
jgi:hypothetical protein